MNRTVLAALLLLPGCVPPGMNHAAPMVPDDLEPAVTQRTAGRSGADRDPEVSRDGATLFYASSAHGERFDLYAKAVGSNTTTRLTSTPGDKRFPRVNPANPRMLQ